MLWAPYKLVFFGHLDILFYINKNNYISLILFYIKIKLYTNIGHFIEYLE